MTLEQLIETYDEKCIEVCDKLYDLGEFPSVGDFREVLKAFAKNVIEDEDVIKNSDLA